MAEPKLHVVILAGGSGERLFPLSTPDKPKQFLRLFGEFSLLQETILRLQTLPFSTIGVSTIKKYEELVFDQTYELGLKNMSADIWVEGEEAKGTAASMEYVLHRFLFDGLSNLNDLFLFCPCDHVIANKGNFAMAIQKAMEEVAGTNKLMLFGVPVRYKDSRFGHFLTNHDNEVMKFVEKPTSAEIDYLLSHNLETYWNTGIFLGTFAAFQEHLLAKHRAPVGSFDSVCLARRAIPLGSIMAKNADSWGWDDIGNWESLIRHIVTARR